MLSRGSLRARRHLYASFGVALTAYIPGTVAAAFGATADLSAARRERLREVSGALEHACVRARAAACAAVLALLGLALGSPTTDPRSFAAPSQASALSQRRRRERIWPAVRATPCRGPQRPQWPPHVRAGGRWIYVGLRSCMYHKHPRAATFFVPTISARDYPKTNVFWGAL